MTGRAGTGPFGVRSDALPGRADTVRYVTQLGKPTVADVLADARSRGRVAVQPRCGVGGHAEMLALLRELERDAGPDVLTVTIDSHTRLRRFDHARRVLAANPGDLNGYPLVAHGWRRGRELNEAVAAPLEVRHGSPDARDLFDVAVASGITSFEGGGISYNLPYSKDVPLAESLAAWRDVDAACGVLADAGLVVDRELFGTLTAVLVPPSTSLAVSVIEAVAAAREGVRCLSVAYPQGGNVVQDVAALRAIPLLAARHLPADVAVHAVLHQFMGVFPRERAHAEDLILCGALVARLGGAAKVVAKTYQEAYGIPDGEANAAGLRLSDRANSPLLDFVTIDEEQVADECAWILREVGEIVEPVLARAATAHGGLTAAVVEAFADGTLDIPFSASRHARSAVLPRRDADGAIRYRDAGGLPLSRASLVRNHELLGEVDGFVAYGSAHGAMTGAADRASLDALVRGLTDDINYFPGLFGESAAPSGTREAAGSRDAAVSRDADGPHDAYEENRS